MLSPRSSRLDNLLSELEVLLRSSKKDHLIKRLAEFDKICSEKVTALQQDPNLLNRVRHINAEVVKLYADTFLAISLNVFQRLDMQELEDLPKSNSFIKLIDLANTYHQYIVNSFATSPSSEHRILMLERLILIAQRLHQMQDFFTAKAIAEVLISPKVEKLYESAVFGISDNCKAALNELSSFYDPMRRRTAVLFEKVIKPAVGPKLSNLWIPITARKANAESAMLNAQSQDEKEAIKKQTRKDCLAIFADFYSPFPVFNRPVCEELKGQILSNENVSYAHLQRERMDLDSRRTSLMEKIQFLKTGERANTPVTLREIGKLEEQLSLCQEGIVICTAKIEEIVNRNQKGLEKQRSFKSNSKISRKVGTLLRPVTPIPSPGPSSAMLEPISHENDSLIGSQPPLPPSSPALSFDSIDSVDTVPLPSSSPNVDAGSAKDSELDSVFLHPAHSTSEVKNKIAEETLNYGVFNRAAGTTMFVKQDLRDAFERQNKTPPVYIPKSLGTPRN